MNIDTPRPIRSAKHLNAEIHIPPSKSYTNRALIIAALADGNSTIDNYSRSDDSEFMIAALHEFGIEIKRFGNKLEIVGSGGKIRLPSREIFIGNAGSALRFLTTFATLAHGEITLNGDERMQQRPINDLLDTLRSMGVKCDCNNGFPPVKIHGGNFRGGQLNIDASKSSQFVSSILLSAPYAKNPVQLHVKGKVRSLPYIDMSLHIMRSFGAEIITIDPLIFHVDNKQRYIGRHFTIESDASAAMYFFAAAALTHGRVRITNLPADSLQGDLKFVDVLSDMGCTVSKHQDYIEVHGSRLRGIDIDMNELPDCVPTLAVLAAFAEGPTTITNIEQLKYKESNRIISLATELTKIGAGVEVFSDGLTINPKPLHGATIETYNDHRIAMSFAIAGLHVEGIAITNPKCVSKSFPNFWEEFEKIEGKE